MSQDVHRDQMGPPSGTSCGEENILSRIRGMFVDQCGCAAPSRGETVDGDVGGVLAATDADETDAQIYQL